MSTSIDSVDALAEALRLATRNREKHGPWEVQSLNRLVAHAPEDMTATVQSGMTLHSLQERLGEHDQWLPLDPPGGASLTIKELIDQDGSGPHRFGHGTARDWLLGITAVMADGRVITSGAPVVKSVAGYDLHKLLIGARGQLAVLVEATFKLSPRPAAEVVLHLEFPDVDGADLVLKKVMAAPVFPSVLDWYSLKAGHVGLAVGFSGSEREVNAQCSELERLGLKADSGTTSYSDQFHESLQGHPPRRISVVPSGLRNELKAHGGSPFVARAGNGVAYLTPGERGPRRQAGALERRIRTLFDPHGILSTPE